MFLSVIKSSTTFVGIDCSMVKTLSGNVSIYFLYLGISKYVEQDLGAFREVKGIICLDAV